MPGTGLSTVRDFDSFNPLNDRWRFEVTKDGMAAGEVRGSVESPLAKQ